ncbi:MAG: hypothetical protein ACFFFC_17085 [Candidatus Thorarchaeota archaeon]
METTNPFQPMIFSEDIMVTVKEDDEDKKVDAKRYWVRYKVGESSDIRYVDDGDDDIASVEDKTIFMVPSIHRLHGDPFHYDASNTERISGTDRIENETKLLNRLDACESHDMVEIIYESPGVECCAMTKEQADEQEVPLQYMSGYLLGKKNGLMKVALSKTVVDETKHTYYDNIHIIPESTVKEWNCLE